MAQALRGQCLGDLVILRDRLSNKKIRMELQSKSAVIKGRIKMLGKIENTIYRSASFGQQVRNQDITILNKINVFTFTDKYGHYRSRKISF